jgi:type 1 fimbria pilin
MELKTKIIALSACLGLFSSVAFAAITGTSSVQATFVTTIEAGTCSAQVQMQQVRLPPKLVLAMSLNLTSRTKPGLKSLRLCSAVVLA